MDGGKPIFKASDINYFLIQVEVGQFNAAEFRYPQSMIKAERKQAGVTLAVGSLSGGFNYLADFMTGKVFALLRRCPL